jgi:hypothetical protein
MNLNPLRKPVAVDLDELEARIHEAASPPYVTPGIREPRERTPHTPLQVIAQAILGLTWAEAEKMGTGIKAKDGENLTSAIQAWAATWKDFADAIGPRE